MVSQLLGTYMVKTGDLTKEQFEKVREALGKIRVKLGLIAMEEGMLTEEQCNEINRIQQLKDARFGDIAVDNGYLTDAQVGSLLKMQGNEYLSFAQALVDEKVMSLETLAGVLKKYQTEHGFTNSEMEAIKSGEPDRVVPLFLPPGAEEYTDITILALKTLIRVIDAGAYPMEGFISDTASLVMPVTQEMEGDEYWRTGFADENSGLCVLASVFARDIFNEVNEDVQDAVAEFTNCVNGLFATAKSAKNVNFEMLPPLFGKTGTITGSNICVMPFGVGDAVVNFVVTNRKEWREE